MSSGASAAYEKPRSGGVDLHRGDAQVQVDDVGLHTLVTELRERVCERRLHEARAARSLERETLEALVRLGVAIDRDQQTAGPEALGHQPRMAARAECGVDRGLTGLGVERREQLGGENRHVLDGVHDTHPAHPS